MKVENKLLVICSALIVVLGIVVFFLVKNLAETKSKLQNQEQIYNQNQTAYQNQLNQKADSIQNLAAQVSDLNSQNSDLKNKVNVYQQHTQILIDSMNAQGEALANLSSDSSGKYVKVSFEGTQGIFNYSGWTKYYLPPSVLRSLYGINISALPIDLNDVLYYDFQTKTLKTLSNTTTPGVKLLVNTQIDSSVYQGLVTTVNHVQTEKMNVFPSFGLDLKANLGIGTTNVNIKGNQFNGVFFDCSAMAYYKWGNITWYPFAKAVSVGVNYNIDLGNALNKVF